MDFPYPPREATWFNVGQTLELLPHLNPAEPWGAAYPLPKWSEMKNIAAYPRGFDPDAEVDEKVVAKAEIVRLLSSGLGRGCQVLLCKMAEYPQTLAQPQMPFPPSDAKEHLADHFVRNGQFGSKNGASWERRRLRSFRPPQQRSLAERCHAKFSFCSRAQSTSSIQSSVRILTFDG
ncbi:hypothetical protein CKAH01_04811 [Colletotrichum kahawae]|uniref:Uncharacterized protein n=1 Tax=Colletotrichum kahawae TaxID=34407 RepID=A0AAE0D7C0_COLKA|nr:hypothetical protein CKAH01_04811 [Colletotrichum kahawae]